MKAILACLAAASTVLASEKVFNIHDDLDAFPHYEIVFGPSITPDEAQSLLSHNSSNYTPANIDGSTFAAPVMPSEHIRLVMPPTTTQSVVTPPYAFPATATPQPYLCSIPRPIQPSHDETEIEKERIASLSEAERANRRGWELLEGMNGQCIYHVKGWWAYEYCYGVRDSMVKQFHPVVEETGKVKWPLVLDTEKAWFILGKAQPVDRAKTKGEDKKAEGNAETLGDEQKQDDTMDETNEVKPGDVDVASAKKATSSAHFIPPGGTLVNKGDTTYLTHQLTSGTRCDLTYRPREIEIQYHCRPELTQDWIAVVKEITTCSYLMIVQTPRLCKDPAFMKKPVSDSLEIKCRQISEHTRGDMGDEAADSQHDTAILSGKTPESTGPKAQYQNGKLVIGGTVIGAGNYFPTTEGEDSKLKQPANWRSSGTEANPDGELVPEETASGKFKLDAPTRGGPYVGVQPKDGKIVKMASIKRDHPDVVYTVVASGLIGESRWEVLDEKILKVFKLGPNEIGLILRDVDWKMDGKGVDGQRWYLVVLTGPKVEKGLEIRAVVETDGGKKEEKKAVEGTKEESQQENRYDETSDESTEEKDLGGSEEEMVEGVRDEL